MNGDKFLDVMQKDVKKWMNAKLDINVFGKNISATPNYMSILYKELDEESQNFVNGFVDENKETNHEAGYSTHVMIGDDVQGCGAATAARGDALRNPKLLKKMMEPSLDSSVKVAANSYLNMIATEISTDSKAFRKFSDDEVAVSINEDDGDIVVNEDVREDLRRFTEDLSKGGFVNEAVASITTSKLSNRFVDSEGRKIREYNNAGKIYVSSKFSHKNGQPLNHLETAIFSNKNPLNGLEDILENFPKSVSDKKKAVTPVSKQYPVILSGSALGTMIHEALGGHLLSGKYIKEGISTTFKDRIGTQVLPEFMSVIDNPRQEGAFGFYLFDDQGIASKRTPLIENGILKDYLLDRLCAPYFGKKSNGHSRVEWVIGFDQDGRPAPMNPEPRVSNLEISSSSEVPEDALRDIANKYCVDNNKECTLYIESGAGEVDVTTSEFRLYPSRAYKMYPNGRREPVHNFVLVGNAYELLNQIAITSDNYQIATGVCGSDSGGIPTQEIAPSAFIPAVNIQATESIKYKKSLL